MSSLSELGDCITVWSEVLVLIRLDGVVFMMVVVSQIGSVVLTRTVYVLL